MTDTAYYYAPIGRLLLAADGEYLTGLWIEGQKYYPAGVTAEIPAHKSDCPALRAAAEWLDRYFAGEQPAVSELRLAPVGSEFQQLVWQLLCRIPCGQVKTYGELAAEVAAERGLRSMSAQAVGGAVGRNPISIIIPCHRVVGADGSLTGYAGGLENKKYLLALEEGGCR